ncbi:MAG: hypothetical protein AAF297_07075 [Planctomycetota bacterium]
MVGPQHGQTSPDADAEQRSPSARVLERLGCPITRAFAPLRLGVLDTVRA